MPPFDTLLVIVQSKVSNRIFIWDYITSFANYIIPFPNCKHTTASRSLVPLNLLTCESDCLCRRQGLFSDRTSSSLRIITSKVCSKKGMSFTVEVIWKNSRIG